MDRSISFKIEIFIPEANVDTLLAELAKVGVGVIGNYDHCASILIVQGTWRPMPGASPYQGEVGQISRATDAKVEVNCWEENVREAIKAIRRVHPYEEPVINIIPLANHQFMD